MLPKFYPILDPEIAARHGVDPVTAAEQILEGGAKILQFRHKGFFSREVFAQLERVAKLCRDAGALFGSSSTIAPILLLSIGRRCISARTI